MKESFWQSLQDLIKSHSINIDRPAGSVHPHYPDLIYPLAYGYLEDTSSMDGDGIDVWLGSGDRTLINGIFCTIDLIKSDCEIKILLGCSAEEINIIRMFHERNSQAALWLANPTL